MMLPILRVSDTVATIEVDVMPFLGRTSEGGPHAAAFRWLSRLGADFVRFAPWFPNPRVVVAELEPPDCSRNRTHWNTTLLDQIYADFASAVGSHSVAMQLSTLPSWLFTDGLPLNRTPADPWQPDLDYGTTGGKLRDPTCGEAARYVARLVGWYTAGGFMDECGAWHGSGYRYEWALLSVLNEVQHEHFYQGAGRPAAEAYTVCYDAIRRASLKVNPALRFGAPPRPPRARGAAAGRAPLRSSAPLPLRPTPASPPTSTRGHRQPDRSWALSTGRPRATPPSSATSSTPPTTPTARHPTTSLTTIPATSRAQAAARPRCARARASARPASAGPASARPSHPHAADARFGALPAPDPRRRPLDAHRCRRAGGGSDRLRAVRLLARRRRGGRRRAPPSPRAARAAARQRDVHLAASSPHPSPPPPLILPVSPDLRGPGTRAACQTTSRPRTAA